LASCARTQGLRLHWIGASDWWKGALHMALPQIPLTTLNSCIAVCKLGADLFPARAHLVSPRRVAISVLIMNLGMCLLGGLPMCHGAGGLAGQYRFGGRTGAALQLLGLLKVALGLAFGGACIVVSMHCEQLTSQGSRASQQQMVVAGLWPMAAAESLPVP
jgi:hypothetical protein